MFSLVVSLLKGLRGEFGLTISLLSGLMSALAIVAIARHGFVTWSLSAPMVLIMDAYTAAVRLLLGWADPYLQAGLTWLCSLVGWRPTLYPHWRDVFVILSPLTIGLLRAFRIAAFRDAARANSRYGRQKATFGAFIFALVAGTSPIIVAAIVGVMPLQSTSLSTQLLMAASVGIAVLLTSLSPFQSAVWVALLATGVSVLTTWLLSLAFSSTAGLGLAGVAVAMILVGLVFISLSVYDAVLTGPSLDLTPFPNVIVGLTILGSFIGAFCFFAIDAGLKLLTG